MAENEIRAVIDEIGKLTHADLQMAEFYREVLGRLNSPLQPRKCMNTPRQPRLAMTLMMSRA